jgi:hypothetical protein
MNPNIKVAIHSEFIAKENILFLEEWIDYHIQLGIDEFFLYDNSKVQKKSDFNARKRHMIPGKVNKHGINFNDLVKLEDSDISAILLKITEKYAGIVNLIEWSPKDTQGLICQNQKEAHNDCLKKLRSTDIEWCAIIDIDEFIIVNGMYNHNIKNFINAQKPNVSCVSMGQILYDTRFNNINNLITLVNKTGTVKLKRDHSNKYIFRIKDAEYLYIHSCIVVGETIYPTVETIWFNHYKVDFTKKKSLKLSHII